MIVYNPQAHFCRSGETAYATDSKSVGETHGGSNPPSGTTRNLLDFREFSLQKWEVVSTLSVVLPQTLPQNLKNQWISGAQNIVHDSRGFVVHRR